MKNSHVEFIFVNAKQSCSGKLLLSSQNSRIRIGEQLFLGIDRAAAEVLVVNIALELKCSKESFDL